MSSDFSFILAPDIRCTCNCANWIESTHTVISTHCLLTTRIVKKKYVPSSSSRLIQKWLCAVGWIFRFCTFFFSTILKKKQNHVHTSNNRSKSYYKVLQNNLIIEIGACPLNHYRFIIICCFCFHYFELKN